MVRILRGGPNVDLIPLIKPTNHFVPVLDLRDDSSRLIRIRRVRIGVREYRDDDIDSGLLHNQASAGKFHQGRVGRDA